MPGRRMAAGIGASGPKRNAAAGDFGERRIDCRFALGMGHRYRSVRRSEVPGATRDYVHGEMARKALKEKGGITNEVFAPCWTSLRASGGVIYFGGKQSWRWNAGDISLCTFINQG